jgi:hypothetical protein
MTGENCFFAGNALAAAEKTNGQGKALIKKRLKK